MIDGFEIFIDDTDLLDYDTKSLVRLGKGIFTFKEWATSYNLKKPIIIERETGIIMKGSLPYAMNDNGFQFNTRYEQELAFGAIGARLNIDIMKAEVKNFEAAVVVTTPFGYKEFAANHVSVPDMRLSSCDTNIKIFGNKLRSVKMYDAGYNLKNKVSADKRKELIKAGIFNPNGNYIKFEIVHRRPNIYFKKPVLRLGDIFDPTFHSVINDDLINTYDSMIKTGFGIDSSITSLTAEDLLYITLKKVEMEVGTIDIKKKLLESLHEHRKYYNASQKCYRKKTFKKLEAAFKPGLNPTDISSLIKTQLALS